MPITFWNPERLANTTTAGSQTEPSIAVLPDGGTVVAWTDVGPNPDVVRIQRFDAFGAPVGGETTVGNSGNFGLSQVAVLPDGRYAVAWMSSNTNISLQRFQANGALDGGPTVVTTNSSTNFVHAFDLIGLANNSYALAYSTGTPGDGDAALRIISGAGVVGSEIVVDNPAGSSQSTPYLSATASTILVTWFDDSANSGDIQARRFSLTGGAPTAEVTVNTTTAGSQLFSPVALLTTNNHVVVWNDGAALRGQIVDSSGGRVGSEFLVALDAISGDAAAVAATQEGGFVVVYSTTAGSLVAQGFNRLGGLDGATLRIADSVNSLNAVDVSTLPDGRIAVTWSGTAAADGSGTGVFTRILDPRDGVVSGNAAANTLYGNDFRGDQISGFGGNDTMFGLGGDDVMFGGDGDDTMAGGSGHDMLFGEVGGDIMTGGAGSDGLDGGAGTDVALFTLARAQYFLRSFASGGQIFTQVSAATGTDGADVLVNVEVLGFGPSNQAFGLAGIQQNLVSNMDGSYFDDVLFQNSATGQVAYVNMNAGTAGAFTSLLSSLPAGWRLVSSDDFTGDGRADALIQDSNTGATYTLDVASGAPVWGLVAGAMGANFRAIASGDATRDGTADVLVRDNTTGINYIADMEAGGTFGSWILGTSLGIGWRTVGLGDFNGDGASDILVQDIGSGTTYYRDVLNNQWGTVSGPAGAQWVAREAADINGDGYCDVVFRNTSTSDIWWVNMLGGTNAGFNVIASGLTGWDVRGSADVDNDGYRDVIIQNLADGTTYFADMNNGTFGGFGTVSGALGTQWVAVA
ncbi:MAG: hypothetical protein K2X45_11145 [Phreatobacter sp.]|nr:hypothetical protein [Phreatobacter sp.]